MLIAYLESGERSQIFLGRSDYNPLWCIGHNKGSWTNVTALRELTLAPTGAQPWRTTL